MSRTHAHIEGDLTAARFEVERLEAELAATPPTKLTITDAASYGDVCFVKNCGALTITSRRNEGRHTNWIGSSGAPALRDWLNHYFPKETA